MKHVPKQCEIGPHTVQITTHHDLKADDNEDVYGLWLTEDGQYRIKLRENMAPDMKGEVFLHECIECVNGVYELNLPHHKIATLGVGMYQMLKTAGVYPHSRTLDVTPRIPMITKLWDRTFEEWNDILEFAEKHGYSIIKGK